MTNAFRPNGLAPVRNIVGDAFSGQGNIYQIAAADTNGYAPGDPVISSGDGDTNGVAGITIAAATGAIRGVIVGLGAAGEGGLFNPNNLNSIVRPAAAQATDWYALVADDPNLVFEVSEPNSGTPLTSANIGQNINLVANANNGYTSGWTINNTGGATTSTLQVRLLGLAQRADNAFGLGACWLVKINVHEFSAGTSGV